MNKYRQQFLLTKLQDISLEWDKIEIGDYTLHTHPELCITISKKEDKTIILLGSIYDWETPEHTNQQIADILISQHSIEDLFHKIGHFAGHFIIIYRDEQDFLIFGDASGSREIYYDLDFTIFASQVKLLCEFIEPEEYTEKDAIEFYRSPTFKKYRLFIGDTTHYISIKHLLPNKYIHIKNKKVQRYFPVENLISQKIDDVVTEVSKIIKGFLKAAAIRKKLLLATTAGYDSRLLLLASLETDCKYFIYRHRSMKDSHPDIKIPLLLTKLYNKPFEIIDNIEGYEDISHSVDFPFTTPKRSKYYFDHLYLNANINEITRNYYSVRNNITAKILSSAKGYKQHPFILKTYNEWLEEATLNCQQKGYNLAEMFYWEESRGTFYAKGMTADYALGIDTFTPFNSHNLISLLLSVDVKYRNMYNNILYNKLLLGFSKDALKYPINPCFKIFLFKFLTRIGVYNFLKIFYLRYGIKRLMKKEV